jgi:hypothetical protein
MHWAQRRPSMPVRQPLPVAVEKGNFGYDPDTDDPIKPRPREVRAITENHTDSDDPIGMA